MTDNNFQVRRVTNITGDIPVDEQIVCSRKDVENWKLEAEVEALGWAWAIIANAGAVWDDKSKQAQEWREVAWKLEKQFYNKQAQLKENSK